MHPIDQIINSTPRLVTRDTGVRSSLLRRTVLGFLKKARLGLLNTYFALENLNDHRHVARND
jgi:hypothetical protein